jgi:uncharacterized protein (TIGR03084 family)
MRIGGRRQSIDIQCDFRRPSDGASSEFMDPHVLSDLRAEQRLLLASLDGIGEGWDRPTPAEGWTVRDTVAHLLVAERAATLSVSRGIDPLESGLRASYTEQPGDALLAAWQAAATETTDAFARRQDSDRVPWGGRTMSVRSLATARLMECWAHGLDCLAALDRPVTATPRLRHIAWLGYRTLPYAFGVAEVIPPADPAALRIELDGPSGEQWTFGPAESAERITGPALDWCRVATHRLRQGDSMCLSAHGELAVLSLKHARAFL